MFFSYNLSQDINYSSCYTVDFVVYPFLLVAFKYIHI